MSECATAAAAVMCTQAHVSAIWRTGMGREMILCEHDCSTAVRQCDYNTGLCKCSGQAYGDRCQYLFALGIALGPLVVIATTVACATPGALGTTAAILCPARKLPSIFY